MLPVQIKSTRPRYLKPNIFGVAMAYLMAKDGATAQVILALSEMSATEQAAVAKRMVDERDSAEQVDIYPDQHAGPKSHFHSLPVK